MRPETRYTTSGATTIAYQVVGDGPLDLVYVAGWFFNPEVLGDFMPIRRYLERLLSFARVISVEKRGFGMSDRLSPSAPPTVDEHVADIVAVADAEGLGPARTAARRPAKAPRYLRSRSSPSAAPATACST